MRNTVKIPDATDLETTYAYNNRGQLTTATMTRAGTTQVRSFRYDDSLLRRELVQRG